MAWDGSVLPKYADKWWTERSLKHGGKTYVETAINWVTRRLEARRIAVDINGPNAVIRVRAEEDMGPVDRLLAKVHCLRRAGILYKCEQVGDAGPSGLHIPIFKVTLFGEGEGPYGYTVDGLHIDVFLPGRLDVGIVRNLGADRSFLRYSKARRTYADGTNALVERLYGVHARKTFRKACNTARLIAPHVAEFDAFLAKDAARKRARLSSPPANLSDVSVDDDDLVGIG